ncbi:MAG: hypothetical protein K6G45_11925 [Lachnospiraceae bacterium]|nr:hypothetical protein [Lachnospiraceae bacterium]
MCGRIQAAYDESGRKPDIVIDQIKEKWATLRFYYGFENDNPEIHAIDFLGQGTLRKHPGEVVSAHS